MSNIEIEFRSCLNKQKYQEMVDFFSQNGQLILDSERVTTKYEPHDLRIREDWNGNVLMLKIGDLNDPQREEFNVKVDNVEEMKKIIEKLGLNYTHSWKTIRKKYKYKNFIVCIDNIPGFMRLLEIEMSCQDSINSEKTNQMQKEIEDLFSSLGIKAVDPDWFNQQISDYHQNFHSGKISLG